MSLFIAGVSLPTVGLQDAAKLGILVGSLVAASFGLVVLITAQPRKRQGIQVA
jgi:Na+/H+ antiporter NhaA